MAGAQVNDIKARLKSVSGTMQITKAMELVAASKLRGAKEKAEKTAAFSRVIRGAIDKICASDDTVSSPFSVVGEGRELYIVIAGDRGLAGGFNSNIFKLCQKLDQSEDSLYLPVGKKAVEFYKRRGKELYDDSFANSVQISVGNCIRASRRITEDFLSGKISRVTLVYTRFVSMISQLPESTPLLPLKTSGESTDSFDPIFEENPESMLESIVPDYIAGLIYAAASESYASELASRRSAMNSANKNAEEMIDSLMLSFNRARQAVITQEITEIVSGAEAL